MTLQDRRRGLMAQSSGGSPTAHGTWEDLFRAIDAGTYSTEYSVGEILPLDLGTQGIVNAQIVAFNADDKSDNSGKAPITFVSQYILTTSRSFEPFSSPQVYNDWENSNIRTYILNTIAPLFSSLVLNRILSVTKKTQGWNSGASATTLKTSTETLWIPSRREVTGSGESSGVVYTSFFASSTERAKKKASGTAAPWWTRSVSRVLQSNQINIFSLSNTGSYNYYDTISTARGIVVGFCIG